MNNALPDSCDEGEPSKYCTFAVWYDNPDWTPGWCHLAEDGCTNEDGGGGGGSPDKIWKKTGETK